MSVRIWPKTLSILFYVMAIAALFFPASAIAQITVTQVGPTAGPTAGGTNVTIKGTNFTGATSVTFGTSPATSFTVFSATLIKAVDPAHAPGVVDVTVGAALGSGTKMAAYTYVPLPKVFGVAPNSGPTLGGTSVTITGIDLTGANLVKFGGVAATNVVVVSATSITATTPAHAAGAVNVSVHTYGGTGGATNAYTYIASAKLAVTKKLIPSTDPGRVKLLIDGVPRATNVGNGGTTGPVLVTPGVHTVNEAGFGSTDLHDYTRSFSGGCPGGVATVALNVFKTCILTNTRRGWFSRAPMPFAEYDVQTGEINGILYVVGSKLQAYNPATNTWITNLAPIPVWPLVYSGEGAGVGVINNILYVVGGSFAHQSTVYYRNTLAAYNPATNTWNTNLAHMPTARGELAVGVINGKLYAVGGQEPNYSRKVEEYDPTTNLWATKPNMPTKRRELSVGVIGGKLYAVGGSGSGTPEDVATVEMYDPVANTWSTNPTPMPTVRTALGVGVIGGKLYAVGGRNSATIISANEAYDPVSNSWSAKAPKPIARAGLGVGVVNGILYAIGGFGPNGQATTTVEAFNP